jgi:hypothetical protein
MKNVRKFLRPQSPWLCAAAIIAAIAINALSLTGCQQPDSGTTGIPNLKTLSGEVTIGHLTHNTFTTGMELTATYNGSESPVTYQWYKDGEAIPNATSNKYTPEEPGKYTVIVCVAGYTSKTSPEVIVTGVTLADLSGEVTISPAENVLPGMVLTADYSGDEEVTLTYHWHKDGAAILGAANSNEYTPEEEGSFTVIVSAEGYKQKTSNAVIVTGAPLPDLPGEVTISPTENVHPGTKLTAAYSGSEKVTFRWNMDDEAIDDATGEEYTPDEAGSYSVTAHAEGYKSKTSDAVTVTLAFTTAPELTLVPDSGKITYTWTASDPEADSYDVYYIEGDGKTAAQVKASTTKIIGATSGGEITGLTNNTAYSVIVSANKAGYPGIDSEVMTAIPSPPYIITGGSGSFTATQSGGTIGTANQGIQTVIEAIRTHANGKSVIIHFGDGNAALDIAAVSVNFNNTGGTWGFVELSGNITGNSTNTAVTGTNATIIINDTVSVTSTADITNTTTNANAKAIHNNSTGTLTIAGGTVSADTGVAVYNANTGKITVSGTATVTSKNATAASGTIHLAAPTTDNTDLRLEISGGTVENTVSSGNARVIYNASTGAVVVSGGTVQTTQNSTYAIYNNSTGALTISDGTVSVATGRAVHNNGAGTITISGGEIKATGSGYAVYNNVAGALTISDGTFSVATGRAVHNQAGGAVTISGGTFTATSGRAVHNQAAGTVTISGGTYSVTTGDAVYNYGAGTITISNVPVTATTGSAAYNNGTGKIIVSGTAKLTSANSTSSDSSAGGTIVIASSGSATGERLVIEGGTVENTASSYGRAVYNASTGAVIISGGDVSATYYAIYNYSTGAVTISGGTVSATGSNSIAVNNYSTGKITVSGTATKITSENTSQYYGTIYLRSGGSGADVRFEMSGGTVENTSANANARAVYNASTGSVTISGGIISAPVGYALYNISSPITLGGNPNITGKITTITGNVSAVSGFSPSATNMYTLDFTNIATEIAVAGAGSFLSNFTLATNVFNGMTMNLAVKGSDLVLATATANTGYSVANSSGTYVITKGSGTMSTVQDAINYIKTQTNGAASTIQFGDNTNVLDIGNTSLINFDGGAGNWTGKVTLTGKLTSANPISSGVIRLTNGASIDNKAELTITVSPGYLVYNTSSGTLTVSGGEIKSTGGNLSRAVVNAGGTIIVSGGTISTTTGYALNTGGGNITVSSGAITVTGTTSSAYGIYDDGSAIINISGGTVSGSYRAIYSYGGATLTISGGTVSATTGSAVYQQLSGTTTITGGTVSATTGDAIYNQSGTVNISGGTVSATTGRAVYNAYNNRITVSQASPSTPTIITSANTNAAQGTIHINSGTATDVRLEITGGTISNTSTAANGNAIYSNSTCTISMSGGTVSTTATSGRAIHNNTTGAVTISNGTVQAPVNGTAYSIYNNSTGVVTVTSPPAVITGARYPAP